MPTPQSGITPDANTDAQFLILTIKENDSGSLSKTRQTLPSIPELTETLAGNTPMPGSAQPSVLAVMPGISFTPTANPGHGNSMEILRHSMPYGDARESGLFFIAYGKTPEHFHRMLKAMFKADAHGHYDHLMNFSTAVTGCAFFAPSLEFLALNI